MARTKKTKAKKIYEDQREFHNQIGTAATEMLTQFINELKGLMLVPVGDMRDREAVRRRKDQLNVIKETLGVVQTPMKFQTTLAEEFNTKKADEREGKGPNVILLKS
ncbi:hypothetical protein [Polaromonas sp.]|uniref:hypothetical protein n=1 Tax=Polaromonas sp. TaxID=1869339 RepID=UPI003BA9C881